MRFAAITPPLLVLGAAVSCRAPAATPPVPGTDTGAFVVMLGNDTVSAESFTRTGNRVEGVVVRRVPRTVVMRYTMTLAPNGLPSVIEYNTRLPDGSMLPGGARSVIATYTSDSVVTQIFRDETVTRRVAARIPYPAIDGTVSFYGYPIAALRSMGRDSAHFVTYAPGATQPGGSPVARRGDSNRYWVYSFDSPIEVVIDDAGRVLSVDGSRTTERIHARRQPSVDMSAIIASFLARERASGPMVALSPRDSVITTIGGARIAVDYGRPAARGRTIWGPRGVLGDTLWRTGANASTKLTIDRAITIGGHTLQPGIYSIMTLAIPGRYQLIIYFKDSEVARVPLTARPLDPRVERFTILVEPTGDRAGALRLQWDNLELSGAFAVPMGGAG